MKEKRTQDNNTGCVIVLFIIFLLVFLPILIGLVSNNIEKSKQQKHEETLIAEGKVKTHNEVINEIVEIFKNRDEENLKEYLSEDFVYYKSKENIENKYVNYFFNDLDIYTTNYEIEKRGNSIEDKETYKIYWNVVEENKKNGIDKTSQYYCLQTITVILERTVKEDEITYEIERIILKNK